MKVAVKYCGGCNPRYDRVRELERLKERYPEAVFSALDPKKEYDRRLLICGCERVCLKFREELAPADSIVVGSAEELRQVDF